MYDDTEALMAEIAGRAKNAPTVTVTRDRYGYRVDGNFLRRVTTLCSGIPKPWLGGWVGKMVAEFALDHAEEISKLDRTDALKLLKGSPYSKRDDAGDRGTAVHNAIEAFIKREPLPDGMNDDERACADAAREFLKARDSKLLGAEITVFNSTHGYAGTLDLWDSLDGVPWILDWKTSASIYAEHAVQQTAYQHAEFAIVNKSVADAKGKSEAWEGTVIPWGPDMAEKLGIVHVEPTGCTLYPILDPDRLWTIFRAAAHIKKWQLDTDSYRGTPREPVYAEPITLNGEDK